MLTQSALQFIIAARNEAKEKNNGLGWVDMHYAVLDHLIETHKVAETVKEFINKHQISCAESILQVDEVMFEMPELLEDLCGKLGYYKLKDAKRGTKTD